ncbi:MULTISPECIES: hypothetical protein [unclassified Leptolyngbya]|uniref:hypothetical protein n=1 Tax=unclassified Leptolyngbya TaxID=2650499 RepID=UPI0016839AFF|nr:MULTISPECIES: hypothetical protein [unclassified Leptolyngbya]MBD1913612.1 hypothetical protein [Leptolyngbya sp. FACHB-8]MBD2154057.1 hypothetical protein [Leptolyngbya sp. FACHB-16]
MAKKEWATKDEISDFCHKHNLLLRESYEKAFKDGKLPKNFPAKPSQALGTTWGEILWVSVPDFKEYCKKHGITSLKQYQELLETGQLPSRFPPKPSNAYNCTLEHLGWARTDIKKGKKKSENEVRKTFERILGEKFSTSRPKWLVVEGNRLELDGYSKELLLAFEYQGEYHYQEVEIHHKHRTLEEVQLNDALKYEICKKHGIDLICIPYTERDNEEYIIASLRGLNRPEVNEKLDYYLANRSEIIHQQIQRELAENAKNLRKGHFRLKLDQIEHWMGVYNDYGYEFAMQLVEQIEKGEVEVVEELNFQPVKKWEVVRFIEFLKQLKQMGRDTLRVCVHLIDDDA